jgi:hypothetical protein
MASRLIIFDWDDTLLPSTWLTNHTNRKTNHSAELEAHQESVCAVLAKAFECGEVIIVTNSQAGWVELSAQRFMPRVVPALSGVRVLSARAEHELEFPDNPHQWKIAAFRKLVDDVCSHGTPHSIVSFGDAVNDRDALRNATSNLTGTFIKTVKFVNRPDIGQLRREVDHVHKHLERICGCSKDLDLMFTMQMLAPKLGC